MNYSKPYSSLGGLLFAAVLLLSGGLAVAQEFRGTILGRITDPSGAAVPGVQITVTNETFNTLNTVIFEPPNTGFTSANFGRIPEPRNAIYFPRSVQMALKLYF
jgi:hypothetical protein